MIPPPTDEERKKYFKIEKSQTAGSSAAWSSDAVKRRKIEEGAQDAARRRERLLKNHVRRHPGLSKDDVTPVLLGREIAGGGVVTRPTPGSIWDVGDVGVAAWAEGLVYKDDVPFASGFGFGSGLSATMRRRRMRGGADGMTVSNTGAGPNVSCLYVGGDDEKTGLGIAYTSEWVPDESP